MQKSQNNPDGGSDPLAQDQGGARIDEHAQQEVLGSTASAWEEQMQKLVQMHKSGLLDQWVEQTYKGASGKKVEEEKKSLASKATKTLTQKQLTAQLKRALEKDDAPSFEALLVQNEHHFEGFGVPKKEVYSKCTGLWRQCVVLGASGCAKVLLDGGFDPVMALSRQWANEPLSDWVQMMGNSCSESLRPSVAVEEKEHAERHMALTVYAKTARDLLRQSLGKAGESKGLLWLDQKGQLHAQQVPQARQVQALLWTVPEKEVFDELCIHQWIERERWWVPQGKMQQAAKGNLTVDGGVPGHQKIWNMWAPQMPKELLESSLIHVRYGCPQAVLAVWQTLGYEDGSVNLMQHVVSQRALKSDYLIQKEYVGVHSIKGLNDRGQALSLMQEQMVRLLTNWISTPEQGDDYIHWVQQQLIKVSRIRDEQHLAESKHGALLEKKPLIELCHPKDNFWWATIKSVADLEAHPGIEQGYVKELNDWLAYLDEQHAVPQKGHVAASEQCDVSLWQCMPAQTLGTWMIQSALAKEQEQQQERYEEQLIQLLVNAHKMGWKMHQIKMSSQIDGDVEYGFVVSDTLSYSMHLALPVYALAVGKKVLAKLLWASESVRSQMLSDPESLSQLSNISIHTGIELLEKWGVAVEKIVDPQTGNNAFHNWFENDEDPYKPVAKIQKFPTLIWQQNKNAKVPLDLVDLSPNEAAQWHTMQAKRIKQGLVKTVQVQKIDAGQHVHEVSKKVLAGGRKKTKSGFKKAL